jgi:hypothetical protein
MCHDGYCSGFPLLVYHQISFGVDTCWKWYWMLGSMSLHLQSLKNFFIIYDTAGEFKKPVTVSGENAKHAKFNETRKTVQDCFACFVKFRVFRVLSSEFVSGIIYPEDPKDIVQHPASSIFLLSRIL